MKNLPILLLFIFLSQSLFAQSDTKNTEWMSYLEELAENEESEESYLENLYEELSFLSENPFNIQTVTKQDLERLPFLTDIQIENLLYYIYRYGPLVDIYELKNVEDLDFRTIMYLLPFVYVGERGDISPDKPAGKSGLKYAKQNVLLGTNFTLQEKAGYKKATEEEKNLHPNRYYLGSPYVLSFRYNYNYKDKIQLGLTGEKDAGEVFWGDGRKGFDFYAFNLMFKDLGLVKTLTFGDYRLAYGEGLVLNNHFSMGKTSDAVNINQKTSDIKRDVSTNESQYFRGVAGTLKFNRLETSFFFSYRQSDATGDSATIKTFKTDGYHRIPGDIEKKNQAETDLYGSRIQWKNESFALGVTAVYYSFGEKELNPDLKPYNLFFLRGKSHYNAGIDYSYRRKKFVLQGETATDKFGKIATIHNLLVNPASFLDWTCSYRYYEKDYNALYAKAFSESSKVQNESGFYTGIKIHPVRYWELSGYWDCFIFPWLKYGVDAPSHGNDFLVQLSYHPKYNLQMNVRYRWKEKYKNQPDGNEHETPVLPYNQRNLRYQLAYRPTNSISLKMQVNYNEYQSLTDNLNGWSIMQNISWTTDKEKFQLDGGLAYFHSPDWNTRVAVYEKNVLYTSSFFTCYGEGLRYYAVLKWTISKPLTLYFKAASTHYFDKNTISSGLEEIAGREKSDLYFLIKYKF